MGATQSIEDAGDQSEDECLSAGDNRTQAHPQDEESISNAPLDGDGSGIRPFTSHLHKLPPELRKNIFREFLSSVTQATPQPPRQLEIIVKKRVNTHSSFKVGPWEGATWRSCIRTLPDFPLHQNTAALLSAYSDLQAEVLDELLVNTVLSFESTDALFGLMLQGGMKLMKAIRYVKVRGKGSYNQEALTGLALCNTLESVTIIGARVTYMHTDRDLTITTLRHEPALEAIKGLTKFDVEVDKRILDNEDRMIPPSAEDHWGPIVYRPFLRGTHPDMQLLQSKIKQPRSLVSDEDILGWLRSNARPQKPGAQESYVLNVLAERSGLLALAGHFEAEAESDDDVVQDEGRTTFTLEPGWAYMRSFI